MTHGAYSCVRWGTVFTEHARIFRVAEVWPAFGVASNRGLAAMSRSDQYRRFAGECLKMAHSTTDEQRRAIFMQMAQVWFALAQRDDANADRNGDPEDEIN